jgi:hypothetical protein
MFSVSLRHSDSDWHRVERALAYFRREVNDLTARGWQQVPS